MVFAATLAILVVMVMAIIRATMGPTLYDRVLAVNMFGTKTVLLISLLGFVMGRPEFLDIAIVYALINFISVIILKSIITSAILSDNMVPRAFSKGIFSYLEMPVALANSPALGTIRFTKYEINTVKTVLANFGLYPNGSSIKLHL